MKNTITGLAIGAWVATAATLGYSQEQTPPAKAPVAPLSQVHNDEEANEVNIKFAEAPKAVQDAALKLTAEKNIKKVSRETDEGMIIYEVEYDSNGKAMSADISDKGDVLSIDTDITADALPAAAASAIKKSFPDGTIKGAEAVQAFYYEVVVMADGKAHEVKVTANGQIKGPHKQDEKDDDDKD